MAKKKKVANLLRLGEVDIPDHSIFVGRWYLLLGRWGLRGSDGLSYHPYINHLSSELKDMVAFLYGTSFAVIIVSPTDSGRQIGKGCLRDQRDQQNWLEEKNDMSYKEKSKSEGSTLVSQIMLMLSIGKLQLLAYHKINSYLALFTSFGRLE